MNDAEYWLAICTKAVPTAASLVDCHWARMLLSDAAVDCQTIGFCGRVWVFQDRSTISAHPGYAPRIGVRA